ncbi:MAG TPA: hypothetical protein VE690_15415, partial [Rhodopila sp.]|nr:hypothetical protein [Rhodopila sp.]
VKLAEPLVGFIREHQGQRVLAVFNLSDEAVAFDPASLAFEGTVFSDGPGVDWDGEQLSGYGVLFIEQRATVLAGVG